MSNCLVLMSDEHNPRYASPYGLSSVQTPHMQALADQGVLYASAYCPSPICMPSRSAFMAGRRVHELQAYSNCTMHVDPSPLSLGAALSQAGVHSVHIGKTDVYAPGRMLGFSEMLRAGDRKFPGGSSHRRNPMTIRTGAAARADGYGEAPHAGAYDIECVDRAVEWLEESAGAIASPWVLFVNIVNPHFPHVAPPEFWRRVEEQDLPAHGSHCETARHPYAEAVRQHFETELFTDEQVRGLRRGYLACVAFVDQQLGRLLEAVEEAGLGESTNIIYTSDHGEMLGKFGMWWKCSLYEDAARVPLIAMGPDFDAGQSVETPVDLHDLQASLFGATGAPQPSGWLGTPLQGISNRDRGRVVFSEYHGHGAPGSSYMIRKGRWKYIHYSGAACQLFDLEADPEELCNLALTEEILAEEMAAELRAVCSPSLENDRAEQFIDQQLRSIEGMA